MKVFIRSNIDDYDQVRSISEVIDSADEEELPPPPQEQANTSYGSVSPGRGKCLFYGIFFFKSRRLVWLNQTILTTSVDLW